MIEKPSIIICSLGRTGTTFFNHFFQKHFPQIDSFHEPATIHYKSKKFLTDLSFNIRYFGFANTILKKALGRWGILNLSRQRICGRISRAEAVRRLEKERAGFIKLLPKNFYLESNYHYYGVLDLLPEVFTKYRAVYIIRDPRDWVRSYINLFGWYHYTDINMHIGNRLSADDFPGDEYKKNWKGLSQFEKLCWAWNKQNSYVRDISQGLPQSNFRWFRFEDIFGKKNGFQEFFDLLEFVCSIDPGRLKAKPEMGESIKQKIHKPKKYFFPKWTEWTSAQARALNKLCGPLMRRFGYGQEEEWQKKLNE